MAAFTRRELLAAGGALLLPQTEARPGRNLIVVLASGGWDVTWALDPRPGDPGVDAPDGEVRRFGGSEILVDRARPAVTEFFERHGPITAVVNGVHVRSVAHPTCTRRILTGSAAAGAPDVGAVVAHALGRSLPLPYLVLGDIAYPGPLAASAGRVGTTNQLQALLDPAADFPGGTPGSRFVPDTDDEALIRGWVEARAERELATRAQRGANRARVGDFLEALERGDALKGYASAFGQRGVTLGLGQQAVVAVDAIRSGLAHSVLLDSRLPWDTHAGNALQGPLHQLLFEGLAGLVDALAATPSAGSGRRLIDDTVVLVLSEMSRTPRFNLTAGKDHWPFTSALVIGGGVAGGKTLGATDGRLEGLPVDLATGRPDARGAALLAENLVAGVMELCGVDASTWLPGVEPLRGLDA